LLRFAILTVMLSAFIAISVIWGSTAGSFIIPSYCYEIIFFLGLSTLGLFGFTVRRINIAAADFVRIYLGATVLRILFFGGFIFTVIFLDPPGAQGNAILFLVSYFLFTILEVIVLLNEINTKKSLRNGQKDR